MKVERKSCIKNLNRILISASFSLPKEKSLCCYGVCSSSIINIERHTKLQKQQTHIKSEQKNNVWSCKKREKNSESLFTAAWHIYRITLELSSLEAKCCKTVSLSSKQILWFPSRLRGCFCTCTSSPLSSLKVFWLLQKMLFQFGFSPSRLTLSRSRSLSGLRIISFDCA